MGGYGLFSELSAPTLACLLGVFVLAGLVKGVVGLGLPTIAMALLVLVMPPAAAAGLLIAPSLLTNIWQIGRLHTASPIAKRIAWMLAGVVAGTLAGAVIFGSPAGRMAQGALGIALILYAAWGLFGKAHNLSARASACLGLPVGIITGLITAATGVFVIPAVPYLQALGLDKNGLVQAMGISFTVSTVALAAGLWINAEYRAQDIGISVAMIVPALIGMTAGAALRERLSPAVFKRYFMLALAALGLYQLLAVM